MALNKRNLLGTYHMVQNDAFEPQRTNNFEIQITGLPTVTGRDNMSGTASYVPTSSDDIVTLSVSSFSAPSIQVSPIEVPYQNNIIKFAGKPSFGDCSVKVNDYIGLDVEYVLSAWQKQVYNYEDQTIGLASKYKKTAFVLEYDPSGKNVRSWELNGCWPSQLNLGELSHDGNSVKTVDMTITYDWCRPVVTKKSRKVLTTEK